MHLNDIGIYYVLTATWYTTSGSVNFIYSAHLHSNTIIIFASSAISMQFINIRTCIDVSDVKKYYVLKSIRMRMNLKSHLFVTIKHVFFSSSFIQLLLNLDGIKHFQWGREWNLTLFLLYNVLMMASLIYLYTIRYDQ